METVILEAKGVEIFLYRGQSGGQCVLKYLQAVRLGLLTKSILDGYSGSDLSGLNFGDNECCYCSKLAGNIGVNWKSWGLTGRVEIGGITVVVMHQ